MAEEKKLYTCDDFYIQDKKPENKRLNVLKDSLVKILSQDEKDMLSELKHYQKKQYNLCHKIKNDTDMKVMYLIKFLRNYNCHDGERNIKGQERRYALNKEIIISALHVIYHLLGKKFSDVEDINLAMFRVLMDGTTINQLRDNVFDMLQENSTYEVPAEFTLSYVDFDTDWYSNVDKETIDFCDLSSAFTDFMYDRFYEYYVTRQMEQIKK